MTELKDSGQVASILAGGQVGISSKDADLMREIKCDKSWPICIFDFATTVTVQDFFVFKIRPKMQRVEDQSTGLASKNRLSSLEKQDIDG